MKNIAIINDNEDLRFVTCLRDILKTFDIKCKEFTLRNIMDFNNFDYVILNTETYTHDAELYSSYCFINMDCSYKKGINIYGNIITYGLGTKNTVTVSSLSNENSGFVYCLQRYLNHNALRTLEPQEIPIDVEVKDDTNIYAYIVGITISLIEGNSATLIKNKLEKRVIFS